MGDVRKRVDVAVAVVFNDRGQVLWGCRPEGKPYAGYWEFPGGKVEPGETVWQALVRELKEELDITAQAGAPWFVIEHDYEHALVRLHLYRVWQFSGQVRALEGQAFTWASLDANDLTPILPATEPLLPTLAQPRFMALSNYSQGFEACASRLESALSVVAEPVWVQFREKGLSGAALWDAYRHLQALCQRLGHRVLVNSSNWADLERMSAQRNEPLNPAGIHLTEADLHQVAQGQFKPTGRLIGASVHDEAGLLLAHRVGLQYAVLGAVNATPSHPGQPGMGWAKFSASVQGVRLPVYAIGGLGLEDYEKARAHGAHGVAILSRFTGYTT